MGVTLVVDQHLVGALGSDAANEPFGVAVRLRRPRGSPDHVGALSGEHGVEGAGELPYQPSSEEPQPGRGTARRQLSAPWPGRQWQRKRSAMLLNLLVYGLLIAVLVAAAGLAGRMMGVPPA